jgi:hypothetical protein
MGSVDAASKLYHLKSEYKILNDNWKVKHHRAEEYQEMYIKQKSIMSLIRTEIDAGISDFSPEQMLRLSNSIQDESQRVAIAKRIYKVGRKEEKTRRSDSVSIDCGLCKDRGVTWVLKCGHRLCNMCYADILDDQMAAICPYCKILTPGGGGIEML